MSFLFSLASGNHQSTLRLYESSYPWTLHTMRSDSWLVVKDHSCFVLWHDFSLPHSTLVQHQRGPFLSVFYCHYGHPSEYEEESDYIFQFCFLNVEWEWPSFRLLTSHLFLSLLWRVLSLKPFSIFKWSVIFSSLNCKSFENKYFRSKSLVTSRIHKYSSCLGWGGVHF